MNEFILTVHELSELPQVARKILSDMKDERIFAITGKMGAGKTTLIKAFCDELGVESMVSSPTFALVNEYTDKDHQSIFHFDFYRIKKIEEVYDIGYEEYLFSDNYCFMEWPELIMGLLPAQYVDLSIEEAENGDRIIRYSLKEV